MFFVTVKLIECISSAVRVCCNPCVGPIPKTNMSFFLLLMCAEELISAPKMITFWSNPPPGNEKLPLLSNPIPLPEYPHLSISAFFVKVTAPIKRFFYCRIAIVRTRSTKFINNVNVYYFSMSICNFCLF